MTGTDQVLTMSWYYTYNTIELYECGFNIKNIWKDFKVCLFWSSKSLWHKCSFQYFSCLILFWLSNSFWQQHCYVEKAYTVMVNDHPTNIKKNEQLPPTSNHWTHTHKQISFYSSAYIVLANWSIYICHP
jgi:hypothetical protein